MILLLLPFLIFTGVLSCKEDATDCKPFDDTKFTVDQVIADINQTLNESSEYYTKYQNNLNKFTVQMESRLKSDRILLERLLKLQEHRKIEIHKRYADQCKSLMNCAKRCDNCSTPIYDEVNLIFTCTKGFAFKIETESRQVRCDFSGSSVQLVYEGSEACGVYSGNLECFALPPEITNRHNCTYSCSVTAECKDYKLECGCLKGFNDVSAKFEKPPGSICTKCNNSVPQGTDFVMLYDASSSIDRANNQKMIDFVKQFLDFIEIDKTDNRFSLIKFSNQANMNFPLTPKATTQEIIGSLQYNSRNGQKTNTPAALKMANDEVYAKISSSRPRVTILFTDGHPETYNENAEQIIARIKPEVLKMRESYKAQIITVYVGRDTDEEAVRMMRAITSEDEEVSVENFEDLKNEILDRLQILFC